MPQDDQAISPVRSSTASGGRYTGGLVARVSTTGRGLPVTKNGFRLYMLHAFKKAHRESLCICFVGATFHTLTV